MIMMGEDRKVNSIKQCATCIYYHDDYELNVLACTNEDSEKYEHFTEKADSCEKWMARVSGYKETEQEIVFSHGDFRCPRCGSRNATNYDYRSYFRYCGVCGQKLKWDNVLPDDEKYRIMREYKEGE